MAPPPTPEADSFLWLNETPNNRGVVVRARPKIRSHVRSLTAKRFREAHKDARRSQVQALAARPRIKHKEDCPLKASESSMQSTDQNPCKFCGNPVDAEAIADLVGSKNPPARRESTLIRVLGAGRVDPFSCYPIANLHSSTHELFDHAATYQFPGIYGSDARLSLSPLSDAWLSAALKSPFLFNAILFGSSVHLDCLRTRKVCSNSPRALNYKIAAIEELNKIIANPQKACADEVILGIIFLATHEVFDLSSGKKHPFNSPLSEAQWFHIYGSIHYVAAHMRAVLKLVTLRGGLEKIKLPGVAATICSADVIGATNSLSKPIYPIGETKRSWYNTLKAWAEPLPLPPGFRKLTQIGVTDEMIEVFDAMAAFTLAVDYHFTGIIAGIEIGDVVRARSPIQYKMLSLPYANECSDASIAPRNVYECCRLAGLIYSFGVVYPIPNNYSAFLNLVSNLKISIENFEAENKGEIMASPDWLVWAVVLGGIAALDKRPRKWYVSKLRVVSEERGFVSWESLEPILRQFLWLDMACVEGGRLLWSEVVAETEPTSLPIPIGNSIQGATDAI